MFKLTFLGVVLLCRWCNVLRMRTHILATRRIRSPLTMATSYRKLDKFNPVWGEDWTQYIEYYFLANGITSANMQSAALISAMIAKVYKTLWILITPHNPSNKSFKQLIEIVMKYFCPPLSEIEQRFKFNTWARKPGKSVANYIHQAMSTIPLL